MASNRTAVLYRMVMPEHLCPYGLKAKFLLERKGYDVDDRWLTTRAQTDAFKAEHGVETTPQAFIGGERIGGYDDLRRHFGHVERETSYAPVIALFATTAAMALAMSHAVHGAAFTLAALQWFIALSMCVLAILKLRGVESFSTMFLNYDLLARRWVPYAYAYPFAEGLAGVLMLGDPIFHTLAIPLSLAIGTEGAISVFKAVYIDRRSLKCACMGGDSNVPLGLVSLLENLMMIGMAVWMLVA